jgi:hypothetical protein
MVRRTRRTGAATLKHPSRYTRGYPRLKVELEALEHLHERDALGDDVAGRDEIDEAVALYDGVMLVGATLSEVDPRHPRLCFDGRLSEGLEPAVAGLLAGDGGTLVARSEHDPAGTVRALHEPRLVATVDYDGSSEDIRGGARLGPRWHDARRAIAAGLVGRALDERPEARDAVLSRTVEDHGTHTGSLSVRVREPRTMRVRVRVRGRARRCEVVGRCGLRRAIRTCNPER